MMVEGSRLVLRKDQRSLKLARHMLESAFAIYLLHVASRALISCTPEHKRIYAKYGFSTLAGTAIYQFGEFEGVCVVASSETIPELVSARLSCMAKAYAETGQIYLNSSNRHEFMNRYRVAA